MNRDTHLRIPAQVVMRRVGDETVILNLEAGAYFGLDPIGSRFLKLLEAKGSLAAAAAQMLQEFEVSQEQLEADLLRLAEEMLAAKLLEAA